MRKPLAIFLMGPTCSGKTALAVELVARLPCQIISVDSAMIFRGMNIGTDKPDAAILVRAPHRLLDIRNPDQSYSAAEFRHDALREMAAISAQQKIPLLVGGSGLYFRALARGLSDLPAADQQLRARLDSERERMGLSALHARLAQIDPLAGARIHPNDPQRIQRALEVYELTGKPLSVWWQEGAENADLPYRLLKLALIPADRGWLRARTAQRFATMCQRGLVTEVRGLLQQYALTAAHPSMRVVGYRQVWQFLHGELDEWSMHQKAVHATNQLAKRQLTWLRSEPELHVLTAESAFADLIAFASRLITQEIQHTDAPK